MKRYYKIRTMEVVEQYGKDGVAAKFDEPKIKLFLDRRDADTDENAGKYRPDGYGDIRLYVSLEEGRKLNADSVFVLSLVTE